VPLDPSCRRATHRRSPRNEFSRSSGRAPLGTKRHLKGATFTYEEFVAFSWLMRPGRCGGIFRIRYGLLRTSLLPSLRPLLPATTTRGITTKWFTTTSGRVNTIGTLIAIFASFAPKNKKSTGPGVTATETATMIAMIVTDRARSDRRDARCRQRRPQSPLATAFSGD
jgi:hypothetical protein